MISHNLEEFIKDLHSVHPAPHLRVFSFLRKSLLEKIFQWSTYFPQMFWRYLFIGKKEDGLKWRFWSWSNPFRKITFLYWYKCKRLQGKGVKWLLGRKYVTISSLTKIIGRNEVMYKITTSSLICLIPVFIALLWKKRKLAFQNWMHVLVRPRCSKLLKNLVIKRFSIILQLLLFHSAMFEGHLLRILFYFARICC